jgi:hypothetical protein
MTTTSRQNNLLLNQDWTRIYQTFKNADFKSYDFENLRRVIITYLRENYPEDFNDYIESSEYMALIDAVAFLGQSLAFRIDLASRENFIELAERRESVLRIAKMLGYNTKRNIASSGLLKFTTVTTTEPILDSNGRNLSRQIISWNDPTNENWAEQFILVLNAAMADNTEFGKSQGSAIIQGIKTEQYKFNTTSQDVPIYAFSKTVASRNMNFEIVSTIFKDQEEIYEEPPFPGNQLAFVYRNDGQGPASLNTGFYMLFKQGSLELADFSIEAPTTNERVSVDAANINNSDVWLYSLDSIGQQRDQWLKVSDLVGNNIAYNSIYSNIRNIYAVSTRENDRIDLIFANGVYGNLPQGSFRIYYRVSNGLSYTIAPTDLRGINISIPYINRRGETHTLIIGLALQYTVADSAETESIDSVRVNAPALYYTQNRMITAEDYNLAPLSSSQEILKIKSINRTSSGISRNFEIIDASGKYSSVNLFADDGFIYKEESEKTLNFKFSNRFDIINFLKRKFEPAISETDLYNFYLTKYDKISLSTDDIIWNNVTEDINICTGFFDKNGSKLKVSMDYTENNLRFISPGALVKFIPPENKSFKNGEIVNLNLNDPEQKSRIWSRVIKLVGDGTVNTLLGQGPITFNDHIPTGAIIDQVIPKFITDLPTSLEDELTNQIFQNKNFGLRYDIETASWKIILAANLNVTSDFTLVRSGDITNNNLDASWLASFVKDVDQYVVTIRNLSYIFGSKQQNRFYFDVNERAYNKRIGSVIKDQINILGINTRFDSISNIGSNLIFEIDDVVKFNDGYQSSSEVKVAFIDSDNDGVIDDPDSFIDIVGEESREDNFIFFKEIVDQFGQTYFEITEDISIDNIERRELDALANFNNYKDGDLIYFYDSNENRVKKVDKITNTLILQPQYRGNRGRRDLKFQYVHNASEDRRIDPSSSNIIDIFILTRSYDRSYRQYLIGGLVTEPFPPDTDSLRISFGSTLSPIKSISDEIIYHPVKYKILFGDKADEKLKAQFKIVKNPDRSINDNDLKVRVVGAITDFFDISNWDFGDRFYFSELITYVINITSPDVSNMIILPRQTSQVFGSLFEIQSSPDEIFISGATVDDIEIVDRISAAEVRIDPQRIVNST